MTKEQLKGTRWFHTVDPSELSGLDEFAEYLEAILNNGCSVLELNGELVLLEIKQLVANVRGLKIEIYSKEHPPLHFHVKSATVDASFIIEDCSLLNGKISSGDYNKILYWHQHSKKILIDCWNKTRPSDCAVGEYKGK